MQGYIADYHEFYSTQLGIPYTKLFSSSVTGNSYADDFISGNTQNLLSKQVILLFTSW